MQTCNGDINFFSQFGNRPTVWMFHNRRLNNSINNIHERALKLVYRDFHKSSEELLELDNSVHTHQNNLQMLPTRIYEAEYRKKIQK